MSYYTFEVTKKIVVTFEADSEEEALELAEGGVAEGDYGYSFDRAEPMFVLLDKEEE